MATCVTCGRELHPERAEKYRYCTDSGCRERNAKGLTVLAVGVNKAADLYEIVDERTREKVASGTYVEQLVTGSDAEQRRGADQATGQAAGRRDRDGATGRASRRGGDGRRRAGPRPRWTASQRDLALIYSERGMRPDEIARKLGLSPASVIQIILGARNRPRP